MGPPLSFCELIFPKLKRPSKRLNLCLYEDLVIFTPFVNIYLPKEISNYKEGAKVFTCWVWGTEETVTAPTQLGHEAGGGAKRAKIQSLML